jgi:hypothetical protein
LLKPLDLLRCLSGSPSVSQRRLADAGALYIVRNWELARQVVEEYDARCKEVAAETERYEREPATIPQRIHPTNSQRQKAYRERLARRGALEALLAASARRLHQALTTASEEGFRAYLVSLRAETPQQTLESFIEAAEEIRGY